MYDALSDWEHEAGEYCTRHICNTMGMAHFRSTLYSLNAEKNFPTLIKYLPESNNGYLPFEENKNFKSELIHLKNMGTIRSLILYYEDAEVFLTESQIQSTGTPKPFFCTQRPTWGLITTISLFPIVFESRRFTVEKIAEGYVFEDNDTKATFICKVFFANEHVLDENLFEKMKKIKFSAKDETIDINDAHGYIIDSLLFLIEKSNEIGSPIRWT